MGRYKVGRYKAVEVHGSDYVSVIYMERDGILIVCGSVKPKDARRIARLLNADEARKAKARRRRK